jgi:putative ABC transport system substrate-binding protein
LADLGVTVYLRHCCGSDFSGGRRKVAAPTSASAHAGWFDAAVVADYYRGQSSGQPSHSVSSRALIIAALLLAIATAGLPADAQQTPRLARIGLLFQATPTATAHLSEAFRQGMRDLGYVEGKSFVLELRYGEGRPERLPELARELVGLKLDAIVAAGADLATAAVKRHTQTIPIVMVNITDPVGTGLVASLARPGGNITGLTNISSELSGKRLELLREAVPGLSRVAVLWNPDIRGAVLDYKGTESAARALRLEPQSVEVSHAEDFDRAFSTVTSQRAQAVVVLPNPLAFANRPRIASFAHRNRLPSMYPQREYVDAGGLMSYGPSLPDLFRRAAIYVDKILKGTRPGDLPVEQPSKFELVINLKTAKALGLTIPQSLIQRADQVIQ